MDSIVRYYMWYLNNVNPRFASKDYSARSPTMFAIGCRQCKFFLQFDFQQTTNDLSLFLCRCDDDDGPTSIKVRFKLCLQSADERELHTYERKPFAFRKGGRKGFSIKMSKENLMKEMENNVDTLIITCEAIAFQLSFWHYNKEIQALSEDLWQLLSANDSTANASLLAGGQSFPVHKEILSAHSPVFERLFGTGECCFESPFSPEVVGEMLKFMYSYDISKVNFNNVRLTQLNECAVYYKISALKEILSPRMTCVSSVVDHRFEIHTCQFLHFTLMCKSLYSAEHPPIKMKFDETVEMSTKFRLDSYTTSGRLTLETSLRNLTSTRAVSISMFLLDNFNNRCRAEQRCLEPDDKGTAEFSVQYKSEELFSEQNLILPNDVLALEYELTFHLPHEFSISDADGFDDEEYMDRNRGVSVSLRGHMECVLKSKLFADASLLLPADKNSEVQTSFEVDVHKSVLSARSPVFRDLFKTNQKIPVDFPPFIVDALLKFMYTGALEYLSATALDLLHKAATTYRLCRLKHLCEETVAATLNFKNVFWIYRIAERGDNRELKKSCKDLIRKNKDIFLGSPRWEKFRAKNNTAYQEIKQYVVT